MTFTSQLIVERSELGSRASVKEQGERCASSNRASPPAGRAGAEQVQAWSPARTAELSSLLVH